MSYKMGTSQRRIAFNEGVPAGTVSGIIDRYNEQESAASRPRSGRPPLLLERDKRVIIRAITNFPFIKLSDLVTEAGLTCSTKMLSRWLKKEGIHHNRALQRPYLTNLHAQKRLTFAIKYRGKPASFWKRWIFSDETTIARGQGDRVKWVFHRKVHTHPPSSPLVLSTY